MSDLFGNTLSTLPKWMSPSEFSIASENASASIGHNFSSSMNASAGRKQQQGQFDAMLPIKQQEADNENLKIKSDLASSALKNAKEGQDLKLWNQDQASIGEWMNTNPTIGQRLNATPPTLFTEKGQSVFTNSRSMDAGTTLGMTLKADQADFAKRLTTIPADDRSEILSMSNDPQTGLPTKMKWQALGLVEQRMKEQKQNLETDKSVVPARIRAESAENLANIKGKFSMDQLQAKLQAAANKPVKAFESPSAKAAYGAELDIIKKDEAMDIDQKFSKIAELEKNYKVNNPEGQAAKPTVDVSKTAKTIIQNGEKFNLNPDGSYQWLGHAD